MFTGLIPKVGRLERLDRTGGGACITILYDSRESPLEQGESVAVQGACLTVSRAGRDEFTCDVLDETLQRTNLGARQTGSLLNIERALKLGDRLGGHLVSGHIDGIGTLQSIRRIGRDRVLTVECSAELIGGIVLKGSIACDGVSLTVSGLSAGSFEVNIIPFTWDNTSFRDLRPGDAVNLETDMLGKYVLRYVAGAGRGNDLTEDRLRQAGFP